MILNKDIKEFVDFILNTDIQRIRVHGKHLDIELERFNESKFGSDSVIKTHSESSLIEESKVPNNKQNSGSSNSTLVIKAPMVGIIHLGKGELVGKHFSSGDVLGQIESMKVFTDIKASENATIKQVLVSDGAAVEFDQSLFELEIGE